jgi:hypothetical protein
MSMIYKDDWEKCKERFNAFWAGEIIDRCCFAVTAPRNKPLYPGVEFKEARDLTQKWTDPEYRYKEAMHHFSNTFYGGEAFPLFWNNLGPGTGASFMGAGFKLAENTIWFDADPIIHDWESMPEIKFNQECEMWKTVWDMTGLFCREAKDNYAVGITDIGGNFDIAVSLRGNDKLLYDLYDHPYEVKALIERIDDIWIQIYDKLQALTARYMEGVSAWMGLWCEKRWYPLQCDFCAMISPEMFDEFVKPSLQKEASLLDHAIYHLDGPGQIRHLDSLLEIDGINGIQCVPGSALFKNTGEFHPTFCNEKWIPVLKKIQDKKKNLVLHEVHPSEIDELMDILSPEGVYISTTCKTEDDARELIKKVEKWK